MPWRMFMTDREHSASPKPQKLEAKQQIADLSKLREAELAVAVFDHELPWVPTIREGRTPDNRSGGSVE